MEIKNVAAVVTGGGSGLGEATARNLAAAGAKVTILDMNLEAASKVAAEIKGLALSCNVTSDAGVEQALAKAQERHGPARICVNCAGIDTPARIVGRKGPMPLDDFRRVLEVNLVGTFNVMRLAASAMMNLEALGESGERGVIVNTSSVAATEGQIGQAPYTASKAGIAGLTLQAAREFGKFGIRVMTIAPGLFVTPMWQGTPDEIYASLTEQMVFPKRMGRPDEFAKLVAHIIDNAMLNGEVIRLDGALRMSAQ